MQHPLEEDYHKVLEEDYHKVQLIEFHDTGTIIGLKDHNEMVGWFPYSPQDSRINADQLFAKVVEGVLFVLFYLSGSEPNDIIEQTLTYKGNFTAWWAVN